jgi:hypothetical protein
MSPSPVWSSTEEAPVFQALAAAQHAAWRVAAERRRTVFSDTFRKLVSKAAADRHLMSALIMFDAQSEPPAGFVDPPDNMHFECCPNCQRINGKRFNHAPYGRVKLNALRDRDWLARQLEAGRSIAHIAEQLSCNDASVRNWLDKHGLERRRAMVHDDDVAALHDAGRAPGEIAASLDLKVDDVRRALKRARGVTHSAGHHYFTREWWVERIVTKQMTTIACARAAGVTNQNASYWCKKFGLQEITAARSVRFTRKRHTYKYPQLTDPAQLRALVEQHGSWEGVSLALTGKRTSANGVKVWWQTHFGAEVPPLKRLRAKNLDERSIPTWWTERLDRGLTVAQLAEEAGIKEKSVEETLRRMGGDLLGRAYRNNLAAEKAKRAPKRPDWIHGARAAS